MLCRAVTRHRSPFLTKSRPPSTARVRRLARVTTTSPVPARLPSCSRTPSGSTSPAVTRSARARAHSAATSTLEADTINVEQPAAWSPRHASYTSSSIPWRLPSVSRLRES